VWGAGRSAEKNMVAAEDTKSCLKNTLLGPLPGEDVEARKSRMESVGLWELLGKGAMAG